MKTRTILLVLILLSGCRSNASMEEKILSKAKHVANEGKALAEVKAAFSNATLVVRGTILNCHTNVEASAKQTEVATEQGWAAILVSPKEVLKGDKKTDSLWINNCGHPSVFESSAFPYNQTFTNGQSCFFFLISDKTLSRWCQMEVYTRIKTVPLK
jgi:hypothetical protein